MTYDHNGGESPLPDRTPGFPDRGQESFPDPILFEWINKGNGISTPKGDR